MYKFVYVTLLYVGVIEMLSRLMCKTLHLLSNTDKCFVCAFVEGFKWNYIHTLLFLPNNNAPVKKETSNYHLNTDKIFFVK